MAKADANMLLHTLCHQDLDEILNKRNRIQKLKEVNAPNHMIDRERRLMDEIRTDLTITLGALTGV